MSLDSLAPANSQKVRATAVSAFARFLREHDVSEDYVHASIQGDPSGTRLVAVMDRFGLHLAYKVGKDGKPLAKNSVMSYYRHVKLWLLDKFPQLRDHTEGDLMRKGKTLERHCQKRVEGGQVNKAPSCRKEDLSVLVQSLYTAASSSRDYQDIALLCLMWHCFGRASDLAFLQKEHVSMAADGAIYVRLLRVKTSQEQGLTLVPDRTSFLACPITALSVALAMQESPSSALLSQLPSLIAPVAAAVDPQMPLHELLAADPLGVAHAVAPTSQSKGPSKLKAEVGVRGYINRLLRRVEPQELAARALTSHSFRRGGAQHANGDDRLSAQWILDRGAWNMSSANRGFAYVFNTPKEDRKIARVLSGWGPDEKPLSVCAASLDSCTSDGLERLQRVLFGACFGHGTRRLNVDSAVLATLAATLVLQFPLIKALNEHAPVVLRVPASVRAAGYSDIDLVAWAAVLSQSARSANESSSCDGKTTSAPVVCHRDAAMIGELVSINRKLSERLRVCETALLRLPGQEDKRADKRARDDDVGDGAVPSVAQPLKRRKSPPTNLASVWYAWYTQAPRMWEGGDRKRRSEARLAVAYLKIFLTTGFELDESSSAFKDAVRATGGAAEAALLRHLRARSFTASGYGTVLKELRRLHRSGELDSMIAEHRLLLRSERIKDPAPRSTQDILAPTGQA